MTRPAAMSPAMALALEANFGSVERWCAAFAAAGPDLGGGPGPAVMVFEPGHGTLVIERAGHAPDARSTGVPILAWDAGEGAASPDADAGAPFDAFMQRIDWTVVQRRYQQAVEAASAPYGVPPGEVGDALILDVRRAGAYAQAVTVVPGARWCDPARVADWGATRPAAQAVVVYCVHGHEVSRATALRLRAAGWPARFLHGGIEGWQAAGRPLAPTPPGAGPA